MKLSVFTLHYWQDHYEGRNVDVRYCGSYIHPSDINKYIQEKGCTLVDDDRRLLQHVRCQLSIIPDSVLEDCEARVTGINIDAVFMSTESHRNLYVFNVNISVQ